MLRRSFIRRNYQPTNPDTNPMHMYSPEGWHYLNLQGMTKPRRQNRVAAGPYRGKNFNKYPSVWIDHVDDMHPSMQHALAPYLSKLIVTRRIPNTTPQDAVKDFTEVAPLVDVTTRHAWLVKVAQLCGLHKKADLILPLWTTECQEMYVVANDKKPPLNLVKAMLYCCAKSRAAEWEGFFKCSMKHKWNLTPHFEPILWSSILKGAGMRGDEDGVVTVLAEAVDVQADFEHFCNNSLIAAFNSITKTQNYEYLKKFLFNLSAEKVLAVHRRYVSLHSKEDDAKASLGGDGLKDNEAVFYHLQWHNTVRQPMHFSPRQLYFNHKETSAVSAVANRSKAMGEDIIKAKIDKWKEDGLLPQDYDFQGSFFDKSKSYKMGTRSEQWKKRPKFLDDPKHGGGGQT